MPDQTKDEIRLVQEINKAREYERKKAQKEIEEEIQKENEDYLKEIQTKIQKGKTMADRVIYKLTEYNSSTGEEKIVYGHTKQSLEDQMPTVSEDQKITEINFDANDMNDLCDQLNSDVIEEDE